MTLMDLGQRVLLQRRALGLSQEELAERCGFRYQVISRLERGHQDIYAMRLARIAQELGVSADYLLGLQETPIVSAATLADPMDVPLPARETPTPAAAPPPAPRRKTAKPARATARRRTARPSKD